MLRSDRQCLDGEVEIDETFVGGVDHDGKRGRGVRKCIAVIALELKAPKGFGRVHLRHALDALSESLVPFVCDAVAPGSIVLTDAWGGYNDLVNYPFTHKAVSLSALADPAHVVIPGVHRVASLIKRWILGTNQGSVDLIHLQAYLKEFTVRFNRRSPRSRWLVFRRRSEKTVIVGLIIGADVTRGCSWPVDPKM